MKKKKKAIMWAWWSNEDKKFYHVYPSEPVVRMCSPDGFENAEKDKEGFVAQVKIEVV